MRTLSLCFLLACSACSSSPSRNQLTESSTPPEIKTEAFWSSHVSAEGDFNSKLLSRAPNEIIQHLTADNKKYGFDGHPEAIDLDEALRSEINQAWNELPEGIRGVVQQNLAAIMVIKGLGSTGYTEIILDSRNRGKKAFIVLDVERINQSANSWFTSKERTPFFGLGYFNLEGKIAEKKDDSRLGSIQFILLHEFGHVVSVGSEYTPSWSENEQKRTQHNSFAKLSWYVRGHEAKESIYDEKVFKERTSLSFYQKGKIAASQMLKTYRDLEDTNFISLYGAVSVHDDFAESFAIYVHHHLMKKPYRVAIKKGSIIQKYFTPCWEQPRCQDKLNVLEHFLKARSKSQQVSPLASMPAQSQ